MRPSQTLYVFQFEDLTQADLISQSLAAKRKGYGFIDFLKSFYIDSCKAIGELKQAGSGN